MKPTKKSSPPSKKYPPDSFMYKVRKRRIIEILAAFIGGGWLTWEAVNWILVEHYHFPEKLLDITLVTLIGALLCTLTWWWFGDETKPRKIKAELILIPLFVLITAIMDIRFIQQMGEHEAVTQEMPEIDPNRIVVAVFENQTGMPDLDHLGRIAHDWITQGIQRIGGISVASRLPDKKSKKRDKETDFVRWISHETYAGKVVTGTYYLQGETLQFHSKVHDALKGKLLHALEPVSGSIENPVETIDNLRQQVMGQLAIISDETMENIMQTETKLPTYEAYLDYMEGQRLSSSFKYKQAIEHYKRSYTLDPDFLMPLFGWYFAHRNVGEPAQAEPILKKLIQNRDKLSPVNRFYLDAVKSAFYGNKVDEYKALRQAAQMDIEFSYDYGLNAISLNRPREAIAAFKALDPERGGMKGRTSYWDQLTLAYHMLGEHEQELEEARQARKQYPDDLSVLWYEVRAQAALGKIKEANELIEESFNLLPTSGFNPGVIMLNASMELTHQGHKEASLEMLKRSLDWHKDRPQREAETRSFRYTLARVFYYSGMWEEAKSLYEALFRENPGNVRYLGWLGSTLARMGDKEGALKISKELEELDRPYLLGHHTFRRARIAAVLGKKETAMKLLYKALAQGYTCKKLHPTSDFETLWDYPPFQELIKPKG